ncbi:MAG: hypothetical protein H6605_06395 [Flavobacteriales bacterium]|nr:hypothetical protein [Flavobacteriales bacterium]
MNAYDKKLLQISLQHKIVEMLKQDNGVSCHFDYHVNIMSDDETIKLNLLTYNPNHENYMLLHSSSGKSSIDCLKKMILYLEEFYNKEYLYSFTIEWKKKGETITHTSYFRAKDEDGAKLKFLHEKNESEYEYTIFKNPIS